MVEREEDVEEDDIDLIEMEIINDLEQIKMYDTRTVRAAVPLVLESGSQVKK